LSFAGDTFDRQAELTLSRECFVGYGQGSVTEDKRSGKWLARYRGPDGRQRSKTFTRKTDARKFLSSMQADKVRGTWIDPQGAQTPFDRWAHEWFQSQHRLGPHARDRDGGLLSNHIIPGFGATPLGRIGPLDVRRWINELILGTGPTSNLIDASGRSRPRIPLSPRTLQPCYRIFSAIMRSAVDARLIGIAPTGRGIVYLPKIERKPERFLSELELERLADAISPHYSVLVVAAAYTGCRWQELAGLKRCYLDLDKGLIHVRGVLERVKGDVRYKEHPKTQSSRRAVGLPRFLVDALREHIAGQPVHEYVFTSPKGFVLRSSNFKRPWKSAVEAAGLSPLTFHDLRHTHAAWLIRDGVAPEALKRRLGHKSIRTTMDVYGHLFPNFEDAVIETLDRRRDEALSGETAKIIRLQA
jgi:integrase